jgi:MoaA/NifB/PqqE/SkfB family radical SAM enzyme
MTLPSTICMLPWVSIETSPMGTTRPCCLAHDEITDATGKKYDLNETNLEVVYHSEYMQDLRRQFRRGERPATCNRCWEEEAAGRDSKRINSQLRLKHLYQQVDWANDDPDQLWFVDLKLGNICNLKCRICGSWSSSKWAEEEMAYLPPEENKREHIAYAWLKQGAWPRKTTTFWDNMKTLLPNIKYMEFTGGEPWLIEEHWELLEFAVAQGHGKNIDIHYNTNATQTPARLVPILSELGRVDIAFSIDNVDARFEYERYGARWAEANKIIDATHRLQLMHPNVTTQLCFTINIQNVYYLDELLSWAETKNFGSIYFNMLHSPAHMSVQYMTPAAKQLVLDKLKTDFWKISKYQRDIDSLINFIEAGPGSDGKMFMHTMTQTDRYRKQSFTDTHPEIARVMGYE